MTIEVALAISILSVSFSIFFGLKNNKRTDNKEIADRVAWNTKIEYKLDSIDAKTTGIKDEINAISNKTDTLTERMIRVESSCKQAHKRLDAYEGNKKGGNDDYE